MIDTAKYCLSTERLRMRHWSVNDAGRLYLLAKDERVGRPAGWPAHKTVDESERVIKEYFLSSEVFAIELAYSSELIGCIGLTPFFRDELSLPVFNSECVHSELSYWLGCDYWGHGYATEAVDAMLSYVRREGARCVWLCYYESNLRSARVAQKCGFTKKCEISTSGNLCSTEREVVTLYEIKTTE